MNLTLIPASDIATKVCSDTLTFHGPYLICVADDDCFRIIQSCEDKEHAEIVKAALKRTYKRIIVVPNFEA